MVLLGRIYSIRGEYFFKVRFRSIGMRLVHLNLKAFPVRCHYYFLLRGALSNWSEAVFRRTFHPDERYGPGNESAPPTKLNRL